MPVRSRLSILILLALWVCASGCSKDLPGAWKAVPADADFVGTIDAKASIAFAKQLLPKLAPAGVQDQLPNLEALTKQAMQMFGIDIGKLTKVHFFGQISTEQGAAIAEGLTLDGLKGQKQADHKGVALYDVGGEIHYAELKGLGLAIAPNQQLLKKVIDTHQGDAKGLSGTERGKLVEELLKVHAELTMLRVYMLTGQLPGDPLGLPFQFQGGGMFLDIDRGGALAVLADQASVDKIAQAVGMGLVALQAALMMGGGEDMPVKLDKQTKDVLSSMLGKIRTEKKERQVTISFTGDLKPVIEKVAALGAQAMQAEMPPAGSPGSAGDLPDDDDAADDDDDADDDAPPAKAAPPTVQ